jgi:hypothetical protein
MMRVCKGKKLDVLSLHRSN